jgi:uncharacterized protein (DUF2147 family)
MLIALLLAAAVSTGAPDAEGLWRTPGDGGVVRVSHCGASLCATLLTSDRIRQDPGLVDAHNPDAALRKRPLKGVELFKDFKRSDGAWRDGEIYNPHDGGTYHATVELEGPDRLKVTGCIFAPLCKTQVWERLPADAAGKSAP